MDIRCKIGQEQLVVVSLFVRRNVPCAKKLHREEFAKVLLR